MHAKIFVTKIAYVFVHVMFSIEFHENIYYVTNSNSIIKIVVFCESLLSNLSCCYVNLVHVDR